MEGASKNMGPGPHRLAGPGAGKRRMRLLRTILLAGLPILASVCSAFAADPPTAPDAAGAPAGARRPDNAAMARHVADALAAEPETLDEWE